MLEVYDRALRKLQVLHLAHGIVEEEPLGGVGTLTFSLPEDDPKAESLAPLCFVRSDSGVFYRLLLDGARRQETGEKTYTCEHAIATLVDDLMFGTHIIGGIDYDTRQAIEYILQKQTVRRWRLGTCDFGKQFAYGFESENLLNALFSLPNLFTEPYQWTYDFTSLPWTLHLRRLDEAAPPDLYIRAGKNLIASEESRTAAGVCTRLYLLGYGEGDNQLNISNLNEGKPYLESPANYIDRYGLISKVYVDRQFEDAESLMERGKALLSAMQDPPRSRRFKAADLYPITGDPLDQARAGGLARLAEDGSTAYITLVRRYLDTPGDMEIELSTAPTDVARSIADIADRQRIEQVYSQGATQIYSQSIQANADTKTQAVLCFFIPPEMRIVNRVAAKISIEPFRSYNRVTSGGGGSTSTSSAGGGGTETSAASGAGNYTSESGGGATRTTSQASLETSYPNVHFTAYDGTGSTGSASPSTGSAGSHYHSVNSHRHTAPSGGGYTDSVSGQTATSGAHTHSISSHAHSVPSHTHQMDHTHGYGHSHTVDIPAHTHRVGVSSHQHSVSIPSHSHSVTVPEHTHQIEQGIFRFGSPTGAGIYVNGTHKLDMEKEREIDLTEHLLGSQGKIPRGSWIRLGVLPNDLAYVTIDMYVQGFVQSRGGGSY